MKFFTSSDADRGATMVEYGLITSLISLLSFSAVTLVGDSTADKFDDVATAMEDTSGGGGGPVSTPGGGSGGSGSGGGSATTTSTTLPPATTSTTAPATTTTTAAPTTTTLPPTTTTTLAPPAGGSTANPTETGSDFTWWNDTKHGGDGEWKASVEFSNDWIRHQYLTLEVTEIDEKGREHTKTVNSFYVPAGGSATFDHWGNDLKDHKGKITGVVEVRVEVVSITTSDEGWDDVTYPQGGDNVTTVTAPELP